ncbi:hypothetical protein ACLBXM_10575 [Xanthobacteraceae bacterium A53D]
MPKLSDLTVVLIDDTLRDQFIGYTGFGFYLVDPEQRVHAGPFRSRAAANEHLDDLWEQRRTG